LRKCQPAQDVGGLFARHVVDEPLVVCFGGLVLAQAELACGQATAHSDARRVARRGRFSGQVAVQKSVDSAESTVDLSGAVGLAGVAQGRLRTFQRVGDTGKCAGGLSGVGLRAEKLVDEPGGGREVGAAQHHDLNAQRFAPQGHVLVSVLHGVRGVEQLSGGSAVGLGQLHQMFAGGGRDVRDDSSQLALRCSRSVGPVGQEPDDGRLDWGNPQACFGGVRLGRGALQMLPGDDRQPVERFQVDG